MPLQLPLRCARMNNFSDIIIVFYELWLVKNLDTQELRTNFSIVKRNPIGIEPAAR